MADYSDAVTSGVFNWLTVNDPIVRAAISQAVERGLQNSSDRAIREMVAGVMLEIGKFFEANRAELITTIAASVATNWHSRRETPRRADDGSSG